MNQHEGVIAAHNVTKQFKAMPSGAVPVVACDQLSFELKAGKLLSVVGPNGSGKTTLIRILAGIIWPDQGTVRIAGCTLPKDDMKARTLFSVVMADTKNFYHRLTGRENLRVFASFYNLSPSFAKNKIKELASFFEMEGYLDRPFEQYSSGMKQRFALARGLLNDAPILLMDEPTKNLDPAMARRFCRHLKDELIRKRKKTILITSHSLFEVAEISDEIAVMANGKMKARGSLEDLRSQAGPNASLEDMYDFFVRR